MTKRICALCELPMFTSQTGYWLTENKFTDMHRKCMRSALKRIITSNAEFRDYRDWKNKQSEATK